MPKKSYSSPDVNVVKQPLNKDFKSSTISVVRDAGERKVARSNRVRAVSSGFVNRASSIQYVGKLLVFLLLACVVIRTLVAGVSGTPKLPSFQSLLNFITQLPSVDFSFDLLGSIEGNWIVDFGLLGEVSFDWLRVAINAILSGLSIFYWIGSNIVYVFKFFFAFIRWLFVG